ncbi:MAG: chromate transporter [Clostridiales bacterium]|jgi:chromate transporter|nr:chromate transporter [Clostridiales bacterium]
MILLKLFWSFFQIGLFSIGGGYAAMPLIQNQVVDINGWLSMSEFADVITISQMTPGPIAINSATFVGIRIAGLPGAIIATIGCVFPSCIIVLTLAYVYYKYRGISTVQGVLNGLRPAVIAMIGSAGIALVTLAFWNGKGVSDKLGDLDFISVGIFLTALFILRKWKVNPIYVMVGAGVIGICIYPFI